MTSLVLDQPGYQLTIQEGLLHLSHAERKSRLFPLGELERIVIGPGVLLDSDLLMHLAGLGIELIAIGQKNCAHLYNPETPANALRILQYSVVINVQCRERLAQKIIFSRYQSQNKVLIKLNAPRLSWDGNLATSSLMLKEANLSRLYWQAWRQALPNSGFTGRQRRPPNDPINALLSLSSTLEDQSLLRPFLAEGFDINLGIHHSTGYRRHSLLLDIKELTRGELENHVLDLWLNSCLTSEHFCHDDKGCRLTREGQKIFYTDWFSWLATRRQSLRRLARLCRRLLEREARNA